MLTAVDKNEKKAAAIELKKQHLFLLFDKEWTKQNKKKSQILNMAGSYDPNSHGVLKQMLTTILSGSSTKISTRK